MRSPSKSLSLLAAASLTVGLVPAALASPADTTAESDRDAAPAAVEPRLSLTLAGTHETEQFDESAAEITSFDPATQRIFVVNAQKGAIDILDGSAPSNPTFVETLSAEGAEAADGSVVPADATVNSVKVHGDWIAVAVESPDKVGHGWALFYSTDGDYLAGVRVGSLPDAITVSPDGTKVVVANEGEPAEDFSSDPEGSVSVIDVADPAEVTQDDVRTARFTAYDEGTELPEGVRVFGPDVEVPEGQESAGRVARNLEPEFSVVSQDSSTAYVSLQEANAIATIDLEAAEVSSVWAIPLKDWSLEGNVLDVSDRDGQDGEGAINLRNAPIVGLAMPDGIDTFTSGGQDLIITANEGDAREWGDYIEPARIKDDEYPLCEDVFGGAEGVAALKEDAELGRLNATTASGLREEDGCYEQIHAFGARGFSILTPEGELVFDSAGMVEEAIVELIEAGELPEQAFNATNDETPSFDNRSDDKGPEPEYVTVGEVGGHTFAFLGLERIGGVMTFDITDPANARFVDYTNNRNWDVEVDGEWVEGMGDLGAEGVEFVSAADSPTGAALVITANEISGSTTVFEVELGGVDRVAGMNRYETAVELSQQFPGDADTVFVTTGQAYPDALVAAAQAGLQDAPVLLTRSMSLTAATRDELQRLAPSRVVVIGGPSAVQPNVERTITSLGFEVARWGGANRYETAASVGEQYEAGADRVYLASGEAYPDALVGSARAAIEGAPVLLTRGDHLPQATSAALAALKPGEVVVLGGPVAISEDVVSRVAEETGVEVQRIGGDNRYETATLLAEGIEGPVDLSFVASGTDYPDALTGAAIAGSRELPILLTRPDKLPATTGGALEGREPTRIVVLGGPEAIAEDILDSLEQFLR